MMETKLIDFSKEELQTLLEVVVVALLDLKNHRLEWMSKFSSSSIYYYRDRPEKLKDYNNLSLWRVQILTAIGKVGVQEEVNSN